MRVSDVFTLSADSGSGRDSYSNFGCSAGDCYAGDYGINTYHYYSVYNPSASSRQGVRPPPGQSFIASACAAICMSVPAGASSRNSP
jgi:hypothetical protein